MGSTARSLGRPAACFERITSARLATTSFSSPTVTSVFSERSEDIAPVLMASKEHGSTRRRQEQAAHDQTQVAWIQSGKLRRQPGASVSDLAREQVHIAGAPAARAVPARSSLLGGALALAASLTHLARVHEKDDNPSAWVLRECQVSAPLPHRATPGSRRAVFIAEARVQGGVR